MNRQDDWCEPATLVEELAIGTLEGEEELVLGTVQEIEPDRRGGVYVFDGQVPALRYYDASGRYVRTLGRDGSGPGEYRDVALGLAVRRDGRLVLRDPRNARLTVYEPGTFPGKVHLPSRTSPSVFRGDTVWGIRRGELDEQYVVRFRVDHGEGVVEPR